MKRTIYISLGAVGFLGCVVALIILIQNDKPITSSLDHAAKSASRFEPFSSENYINPTKSASNSFNSRTNLKKVRTQNSSKSDPPKATNLPLGSSLEPSSLEGSKDDPLAAPSPHPPRLNPYTDPTNLRVLGPSQWLAKPGPLQEALDKELDQKLPQTALAQAKELSLKDAHQELQASVNVVSARCLERHAPPQGSSPTPRGVLHVTLISGRLKEPYVTIAASQTHAELIECLVSKVLLVRLPQALLEVPSQELTFGFEP